MIKTFFDSFVKNEKYEQAFSILTHYKSYKKFLYSAGQGYGCTGGTSYFIQTDLSDQIIHDAVGESIEYIRNQSLINFNFLLDDNQFSKAYRFATVYRDVFSIVDAENAANIQVTSNTWVDQVETTALEEIKAIAETTVALLGRDALREKQITKGLQLISTFSEDVLLRLRLQQRFDEVIQIPLPVISNLQRLTIDREITDQLFS